MLTARYCHGVIQVQNIYIFGGSDVLRPLKQCEKIDLKSTNRTWKALPDMQEAKSQFNPCLYNRWVYVCGGGSKLVEAFTPQNNSFLPLQLRIPEDHPCCLFVHKNLLVVHSENYITKFAAGQAGQLFQHSQVRSKSVYKYSNSQPIVDSTYGLFSIYQLGKVVSFNIETGVLVNSFT